MTVYCDSACILVFFWHIINNNYYWGIDLITDKGRKHLPPYVSYRTFLNFVSSLQQRVPSRIDRSFWGDKFSGSTGTQLMAALRFLRLIDVNGKPTDKLKILATVSGESKTQILRDIANKSFEFVLSNSLDIESATYSQLEEIFNNTFQLTDDVNRKCIKFFIQLANDAGISLSPFITRRTRSTHTVSRAKKSIRGNGNRTERKSAMPQDSQELPGKLSWSKLLLNKFPNFDPDWNDEIKLKWFDAFDELLKRG